MRQERLLCPSQKYDFKKTQEILSDDVDKALRILEDNIEEWDFHEGIITTIFSIL